jgi:Zn-dependent peptidase ImmA (M78 family)
MELGARRTRINPQELLSLKHAYGLSMAAWIYRARDVSVITQRMAQGFFRFFSSRGWRQREPGEPCPPEQARLFEQLLFHALAEDIVSTSKAAELLGMSISAFRQRELTRLRDAVAGQ